MTDGVAAPAAETNDARPTLSTRQAAFIGVGSMVGAGIFALLGAAGEVAGAAVWVSFLLAGGVAALQGYSFAKLGARYPSAGGFLEYVVRGWGPGHFTGVIAWMMLGNAVNSLVLWNFFPMHMRGTPPTFTDVTVESNTIDGTCD